MTDININPEDLIAPEGGTVLEVVYLDGSRTFFGEPGSNRMTGTEVRDGLLLVGVVYLSDGELRVETSAFVVSSLSGWIIDEKAVVTNADDQEAPE